ncbi:bifunctional UDP-N-acetylglucosamine diphosphorylase/glucosamine-1-phosphate N-acetyltransferase GlmU [Thermatribacter velox]|uniref:Bifunctional protein GlmU n=1 Tax=Thermatribacter velox TaxID=3039681 RepID=A0ABZ2YAY0_9BACT
MDLSNWALCVLAAGEGKRMVSQIPKNFIPVLGRPLFAYLFEEIKACQFGEIVVVIRKEMQEYLQEFLAKEPKLKTVFQERPLGTAHALQSALPVLSSSTEKVMAIYADMPLLRSETLSSFASFFLTNQLEVALTTSLVEDPRGYGRVIRSACGEVLEIREEKDCLPEDLAIKEVNIGIFAFDRPTIQDLLARVDNRNQQGEFYLTDVVALARKEKRKLKSYTLPWREEFINLNTPSDLAAVTAYLRNQKNQSLLGQGVKMIDPENTWVDWEVEIGRNTWLYPGTVIEGKSKIGENNRIGPFSLLVDTTTGNSCKIIFSAVEGAVIEDEVEIGPFAHLRPGTHLEKECRIGNFVEVKNSHIGAGTKALHLAYLGDAQIGKKVNIGAGTITCNYDGIRKNPTFIEDEVFIGSNNSLVAPVRIGRGAYTAAGSTITRDVPPGSLGIARARQKNLENWVQKKKEREMKKEQ